VRGVEVVGSVLSIGTSSFRMRYTIRAGQEVAAQITEVLVAVESGRPRPLMEHEREWLATISADEQSHHLPQRKGTGAPVCPSQSHIV
jgi:acyl-CoA thioesterase FadM